VFSAWRARTARSPDTLRSRRARRPSRWPPIPAGVTDEQAAALPTAAVTALRTVDLLGITAGQSLVVMGATGGVGGYAVQMALSRGAYVIATVRGDAGFIKPGGRLVSTIFAADEKWFAGRQITAHNSASSANPLLSPPGLTEVARMLADGTITARIRSTVNLDGVGQILEKLRQGGLRGKAVIRL
jgi:NADPH:quinone reductase-like Zn-dependent oxidoreductase